jgi:hypothetical protein
LPGGTAPREGIRLNPRFDMPEETLELEHGSEDQKYTDPMWRKTLRTFITFVTFVALFPVGLAAQTVSPAAQAPAQTAGYGSGVQTPLQFEGESGPTNQLSLSMGTSAFYDDNVLQNNSPRLADEAVSFDSHLAFSRRTEKLTVSFDYLPYFLLYRQTDQYDRLNHTAGLNLTYRLGSHFNLGLHDTFSYQNGVFQSLAGQQIMSGLSSPTALNQAISPYATRTLANTSGLDLTYVRSKRTSLTLFGGYDQRKYGSHAVGGQPLYNSQGVSGGLGYQYQVTDHTNVGLSVLHQDSKFSGNGVFGSYLRFQSESAFVSVGSRLSPTVTVNIFGGSQYIRTLGLASSAGHFQGSGGGSITKQVRKTALDLSVQRLVSDGGGLYTLVKNTTAGFGVRRRLVGRWEGQLHGGATRADASLFQLANGRTDALLGGFGLMRPLTASATLRLSYDTTHQLTKGALPISGTFDRNQVTISLDYRLKAIPLGR